MRIRWTRRYLKELRDFLLYGIEWYRWLLVALHQDSGHLINVFDQWLAWHSASETQAPALDTYGQPYYSRIEFRNEFLQFVKSHYIPNLSRAKSAVSALVEFELAAGEFGQHPPNDTHQAARGASEMTSRDPNAIDTLASDVPLEQLEAQYEEIIQSLRDKRELESLY